MSRLQTAISSKKAAPNLCETWIYVQYGAIIEVNSQITGGYLEQDPINLVRKIKLAWNGRSMFFFKLEQTSSVASHRVLSPLYSTRKMSRSAFSHVLGHHKCMPGTKAEKHRNAGMPSGALPCGCRKLWCWSSNMFRLVVYLPLWKMMEFVSWDDCSIPNCFWKVIQNSMVPKHQPAFINYSYIYKYLP